MVVPKDDNRFKGVEEEVRGPGRYFLDPVEYDTELVDLVKIPAGNPEKWEWDSNGKLKDLEDATMVGLVTMKQGKDAPQGQQVVPVGFKGIQQEVLTPGTYRFNPYLEEVTLVPAVVVRPGSVGVVTRLVGTGGESAHSCRPPRPNRRGYQPDSERQNPAWICVTCCSRELLPESQNHQNDVMPVGYDEISLDESSSTAVHLTVDGYEFRRISPSSGRAPSDAPDIVATIGDISRIEQNLIEPAMKAACQNEGSKYSAGLINPRSDALAVSGRPFRRFEPAGHTAARFNPTGAGP